MCVKVGGSQSSLEEVMPCTEADLTIPAVLPYVSVDVALVTAITSSSDPCLQVEDHIVFPQGRFLLCGCDPLFFCCDQART